MIQEEMEKRGIDYSQTAKKPSFVIEGDKKAPIRRHKLFMDKPYFNIAHEMSVTMLNRQLPKQYDYNMFTWECQQESEIFFKKKERK